MGEGEKGIVALLAGLAAEPPCRTPCQLLQPRLGCFSECPDTGGAGKAGQGTEAGRDRDPAGLMVPGEGDMEVSPHCVPTALPKPDLGGSGSFPKPRWENPACLTPQG